MPNTGSKLHPRKPRRPHRVRHLVEKQGAEHLGCGLVRVPQLRVCKEHCVRNLNHDQAQHSGARARGTKTAGKIRRQHVPAISSLAEVLAGGQPVVVVLGPHQQVSRSARGCPNQRPCSGNRARAHQSTITFLRRRFELDVVACTKGSVKDKVARDPRTCAVRHFCLPDDNDKARQHERHGVSGPSQCHHTRRPHAESASPSLLQHQMALPHVQSGALLRKKLCLFKAVGKLKSLT